MRVILEFDWMTVTVEPTPRIVSIFRDKWKSLPVLWEKLPRQLVPGEAHESAHRRKTFPLPLMWNEFLSERFFEKTCKDYT